MWDTKLLQSHSKPKASVNTIFCPSDLETASESFSTQPSKQPLPTKSNWHWHWSPFVPLQAFRPTCYFTNHKPLSGEAIGIGASARTERPTLESGRRLIYFLQCSLPPIPYCSEPPYSHKMVSHEDNSSSCVFTSHGGSHFHSLFQQTFTECNTDKSLKERGRCGGRVTLQIMKGLTVWVKGRIAHIDGLCLHWGSTDHGRQIVHYCK